MVDAPSPQPMSATVAPARSLSGHAVQRRDPGWDQVGEVAGPEELLASEEHVLVVLVPAHPGAGAERLGDARLGLQRAEREHERAGNIHGAVRVGQRERLLFGHRVGLRGGVVLHVPASRLPAQPFGDIPRAGPGPPGELFGARRTRRQRPVQAEPVPDNHVPGREGGPQVGDEPAEELLQLVHVNSHDESPVRGVCGCRQLAGGRIAMIGRPVAYGCSTGVPGVRPHSAHDPS